MPDENAHPKMEAFLAAFAESGTISGAAIAADVARGSHYDWMKRVEGYPERFAEAQAKAVDRLETEAVRRAVDGWEEPVFYKGVPCGSILKKSDVLLIFLLKGAKPEKYRERHELTGAEGGAVQIAYKVVEGECWGDA